MSGGGICHEPGRKFLSDEEYVEMAGEIRDALKCGKED